MYWLLFLCAIPSGTHVRKTVFKPNLLRLTAIIKKIVAITSQYQSFYATSALYITCINHRPCLRLNKPPFGAEYVWLKQALGLPSGCLGLISHCLLFFLGGKLSGCLCDDSSHFLFTFDKRWRWTDMDRWYYDGFANDTNGLPVSAPVTLVICVSLAHTFYPRGQSDWRRGGSADTFINSLSTTVVTLTKE